MSTVSVSIDGQPSRVSAVVKDDAVFVALHDFCQSVNAEAKTLAEGGPLAVCREDLCIPLNRTDRPDTATVDGVLFGRLDAFGGPLGFTWDVKDGVLSVMTEQMVPVGLGIGHKPPAFVLPDLYSGASVSIDDYLGKKTVFYMWASW
jgi:hypothetical protein